MRVNGGENAYNILSTQEALNGRQHDGGCDDDSDMDENAATVPRGSHVLCAAEESPLWLGPSSRLSG